MTAKYRESFNIYKANNKQTGSAAQFQIGSKNDCVFLELANQVRPKDDAKPYDWEKKLIVKLGTTDIGKMIHFLSSSDAMLELFHKNEKGNKVVKISAQDNGFYMKVSSKEGDASPVTISVPISWDEATLLRLALEKAFLSILGW